MGLNRLLMSIERRATCLMVLLSVVVVLLVSLVVLLGYRQNRRDTSGYATGSAVSKTKQEATPAQPFSGDPLVDPAQGNQSAAGGFTLRIDFPSVAATPPLIQAKKIAAVAVTPRLTWTATPIPTTTPTPSSTPPPTFVSLEYYAPFPDNLQPGEKWIDVDLGSQYLRAMEGITSVFETKISSGTANHPTVTGQFRIWLRFEAQDMNGRRLGYDYFLEDVPYVQYFFEDYALHGTFWHNNFGTPMSHGCVNLPTPAARWLYEWAGYGTLVNIHE